MFQRKATITADGVLPVRPPEKPVAEDDASIATQAKGKKLAVTSAALKNVPKSILSGQTLQDINLDYNHLMSVPVELFQLPALKKLSLAHNYISVIPDEAVTKCGKKLSSVDLNGNPLAFPPPLIAAKGWSTVKKWVPNNPSFCMLRMYHKETADVLSYIDFDISGIRDTMVKTKDEDRDATFVKLEGQEDLVRLSTINRHHADKTDGWNKRENESGVHLKVIEYIYFSVFDGHCGKWVAQALTTNLVKKFAAAKIFDKEPVDYEPVLKKVFMDLDRTICKKLIEEKWNDGSTAVTVTFKPSEIIFAHVGDSRASAKVGKSDVELTIDHDPGVHKKEKERIVERGGTVTFHKGCWRVNNNLSVSRAFGDVNLKKGILEEKQTLVDADPDVTVRKISSDLDWLIVASDGLWHLMDNKDAVKMASGKLTAEDAGVALMSDLDGNTRSQLKGHDNTTIIVSKLYYGDIPPAFRVKGSI